MPEPVLVSDWRWGKLSIRVGMKVLKEGGSALDAVERGIMAVEDDPLTDSVGTGGIPNFEGVGELDASLMVGNTLRSGAVSCLTHTKNPISVARKVMECSPHVMLCGEGARKFARAMGLGEYDPVTPRARTKWKKLRAKFLAAAKDPSLITRYPSVFGGPTEVSALVKAIGIMMEAGTLEETGTVGTLCLDSAGVIVAGTSTSGWGLRLPGRVSDSSVIGAGTYANAHGASSATGLGEYVIRHNLTREVCNRLERGEEPTEACEETLRTMLKKEKVSRFLGLIALDKRGRVGGACIEERRRFPFSYQYQRLSDSRMTTVIPRPVSR